MDHDAVLIMAARTFCGTSDGACLRGALDRISDWVGLVSAAERQNLMPLLHSATRGLDVPEQARAELEKEYWSSLARSAVFQRELDAVLAVLAGGGIEAIVLKGAAIADSVYEDPALRPMSDVDVLVRKVDFDRARALITSELPYEARVDMAETYMDLTHAVLVGGATGKATFEIHKSLLGDIALRNEESVWENAVRDQRGRLVLSREDTLVHLCAHCALRHQFRSLAQLLDIALVVLRSGPMDWELLAERSAALGASGPVRAALGRMSEVLGVDVLGEAFALLSAARDGRLRGIAFSMVMYGGKRQALRIIGRFALQKGWRGKARYAAWNLFPPVEWISRSAGVHRRLAHPYRAYRAARAGAAFAGYVGMRLVEKARPGRGRRAA